MRLGAKLRELREYQRKSLKEVAERANLSIPQLSKLELGDRGLDVDVFIDIAKALGHQPGDLLPNSAGLYPQFRPLLTRLSGIPDGQRGMVLKAIEALLDMREDTVAACEPQQAVQNVLQFPAPEPMSEDDLERVVRVMRAAGMAEPRRGARGKEYDGRFYGQASAGEGIELFEEIPEEYRQIPEYYWKKGARGVLKAVGDSMMDVGIFSNDILFVKPTPEPATRDLVICTLNRKVFVKELRRDSSGRPVQLLPKNEAYAPIDINPGDEVEFFGVVVGRTGDL